MEKYAVIMAGGAGSRLWPLSRENKPKQFISVDGSKCMLVQSAERLKESVLPEMCFVVTNRKLVEATREVLEGIIPGTNIIAEPLRKNTAACIALTSIVLKKKFGSGILCFVPADGYVKDTAGYAEAIELAFSTAEKTGRLVVIGITPSYPATGYGYIHAGAGEHAYENVSSVLEFVEKPDIETAKGFIASGDYFWNSGIVAGSMDAIIDSIKLFIPEHYSQISRAVSTAGEENYELRIEEAYGKIRDISFDKGVLEKYKGLDAVKGYFDWDDIGSLESLSKTLAMDKSGNSVKGKHVGLDTRNSIIYGDKALIATINVDNMIIAGTKDAVIICPRDKAQDIKALVELIRQEGYKELL